MSVPLSLRSMAVRTFFVGFNAKTIMRVGSRCVLIVIDFLISALIIESISWFIFRWSLFTLLYLSRKWHNFSGVLMHKYIFWLFLFWLFGFWFRLWFLMQENTAGLSKNRFFLLGDTVNFPLVTEVREQKKTSRKDGF